MENLVEHGSLQKCNGLHEYKEAVNNTQQFAYAWNGSEYGNDSLLFYQSYVCQNVLYESTKGVCESAERHSTVVLGVLGLFGAIMTVLTFYRPTFAPSDVYLYRVVGVLETVHMLVMTLVHAMELYDCNQWIACVSLRSYVYMTVTNFCAEAVEFVIVFLCIERTVACLAPQYFGRLHSMRVYKIVVACALFSAVPLNIVHSFEQTVVETEPGIYKENGTWFSTTSYYAYTLGAQLWRFCIMAPVIILATAGSVVGLLQAARRKRKLRGDDSKVSTGSTGSSANAPSRFRLKGAFQNARRDRGSTAPLTTAPVNPAVDRCRKEIKQMIDLCCMQLCLAVPVVVNYILCIAEHVSNNGFIADRHTRLVVAFQELTYSQATELVSKAMSLEYLRVSITVTHLMAHGLHFYLYLTFSAKFRITLAQWICRGQYSTTTQKKFSNGRKENGTSTTAVSCYEPLPVTTKV